MLYCKQQKEDESMTLAEFLKEVRNNRKMTQEEFAGEIGVSVMTVSRIESGKQSVLTENMYNKIKDFLKEEEIPKFEGLNEVKNSEFYKSSRDMYYERKELEESLKNHVLKQFGDIGFCDMQEEHDIKHDSHFLSLKNEKGKTWAIDFSLPERSNDRISQPSYISHFFVKVGRNVFEKYNKYSFLLPNSETQLLFDRLRDVSDRVNYELSILCYDEKTYAITSEVTLSFKKDGNGIFDLDNDKSGEDLENYIKWKESLRPFK